ncbi:motility associated factor glycosyltransferase family protein [Aliiglaciecola litoralis]|uniref:DUF115 domain-containing protein n=1 Tax=Aliiglaciecola litoralis TaxID=582857 RepID=A0ABN1LDK5_9ALTE
MLKNIRLHIESDEQKQAVLDEKLASLILKTHKSNINAFQRNIPSLLPYVRSPELTNYSVFVNKYGENNIVDYGRGRTFYGFHPEQEVLDQLALLEQHCPEIVFQKTATETLSTNSPAQSIEELDSVKRRQRQQPLPYEIECLVVLGCGLGLHLRHLLKQHKIKYLLIYEPEPQYFQCSVMITDWQEIFSLAKDNDTAIFLQLEKDGRDLVQDMNELIEHCSVSSFHLFKHYNHQVFNSLYSDLSEKTWEQIKNSGFSIKSEESYLDYLPSWTPNIDLASHSQLTADNDKLSKNLAAFKKYFPQIYQEYKDYKPKKWLPIANNQGEVNLLKMDSLHTWYGDSPQHDCLLNFENFNQQPTKDGLVLGYNGTKLAHYAHYEFVKETEELLKQAEEEVGTLPDVVPSIIMFGLGVGYQLEELVKDHTVEKLFICEPNRDFFYASLFAIDWQQILESIEQSKSRIYLNIGDDGTNLFRDLLNQFYAVGPYILNNTYFYQSYYNASLNHAISQLREQLQVVISMGEYFDHAYYGIAHTAEGMRRKIPVLAADPASKFTYDEKEVPVFIVGNGPSLDSSIEAIKEWQDRAIVVSCGTALQALHRHGITPDFHAEIEQNRSTFDWAMLIGDPAYLKRITLISCNGIHPDTCDLYKDVMIAFKEGESSTVSTLNVLGRENFAALHNAFPTVSNFACDLFSNIGFTNIYLIGVDLGFVDVKHHHSKLSGYYKENGEETYDYAEKNNTSLIVPGNFRPTVNTKHEFKVSRQVIEQVTSAKPKEQEFYNCSDGARIAGTIPIRPDGLLIVSSTSQKVQTLKVLKSKIFTTKHIDGYVEKYKNVYSQELLMKELAAIESLLKPKVESSKDINKLIDTQKQLLFSSYKTGKSLLFYYLYGTINYTNAMLTKLMNTQAESQETLERCDLARQKWLETFLNIKQLLSSYQLDNFDTSGFRVFKRQNKLSEMKYQNESLLIVSDSEKFKKIVKFYLKTHYPWLVNFKIITSKESLDYKKVPNYSVYYLANTQTVIKGRDASLVLTTKTEDMSLLHDQISYMLIPSINKKTALTDTVTLMQAVLGYCLGHHKSSIVLPRTCATNSDEFGEQPIKIPMENYYIYQHLWYLCIYPKDSNANIKQISNHGSRGKRLLGKLKMKHLVVKHISNEAMCKVRKRRAVLLKSSRK